jgi:predicted permease
VLIAFLTLDRVRTLLPPTMPRIDAVAIDGWALLFAVGAAALTAVAFGMLPALTASRANLAAGVKEGGYATLAPGKERMRDFFIVGQIALGLVLANGAALLVQSYAKLRGQEYGFDIEGTLTLAVNASGPRYETSADRHAYYERVAERVSVVPGVVSAGVVSKLPLGGGTNGNIQVAGRPPRGSADDGPLVEVSSVTGDYFAAIGIPLVLGRTLLPVDSTTGAVGVVINRTMVEEVWPGEDPIGAQFGFDDEPPWLTVVGVVGDVRQWGAERPPKSEVYFPYTRGWSSQGYIVARVAGNPTAVVSAVRRAILEVDPTQPPSNIMAMSERLENAFAQRRFYTTLIGLFAVAALLLASAGIYGTVSYFVTRRVRELGIRIALGAGATGILSLVLTRGIRLAAWGVGAGLIGVWAARSAVGSLVFGVAATDVLTLAGGCLVLGLVAVAASTLPAVRAVRVPPVLALRSE